MSVLFLFSKENWFFVNILENKNEILRVDREEIGERLRGSEENIKRLYNLKSEILNNFSHEVRTPLTTMGNFLELAHLTIEKDSEKALSNIIDAKASFESLKKYILRLSDLSSYQKGSMLYQKKDEDLNDLLNNISNFYADEVDIRVDVSSFLKSRKLKIDALKVKQAICELIENSIIHARSARINIEADISKEFVSIKVKDYFSDFGVYEALSSPGRLESIFDEFEITGGGINGYKGLGLALVREVMKSHGGGASANLYKKNNNSGLEVTLEFPV